MGPHAPVSKVHRLAIYRGTPAQDALVLSFCLSVFPPPTYRLLTVVFACRGIASASPTACLLYSSSARYLLDSS